MTLSCIFWDIWCLYSLRVPGANSGSHTDSEWEESSHGAQREKARSQIRAHLWKRRQPWQTLCNGGESLTNTLSTQIYTKLRLNLSDLEHVKRLEPGETLCVLRGTEDARVNVESVNPTHWEASHFRSQSGRKVRKQACSPWGALFSDMPGCSIALLTD